MDGRGGECCIARYAGGAYDSSKIDRIMLKFRPIAPKPVTSSSGSSSENKPQEGSFKTSRVKRKYVRGDNSTNKRRKSRVASSSSSEEESNHHPMVTLPLLPEKPDEKASDSSSPRSTLDIDPTVVMCNYLPPTWLHPGPGHRRGVATTVVVPQPVRPVGSCVIVESVIDTCTDERELGSTDEEKVKSLEKDGCPGFISDGENNVRWTNEAYMKMVNGGGGSSRPEMVWLVMKEKLPTSTCEAFACRVRLQYTCRKEKIVLTVPCDVWKMEAGGGFAWRLDVKAALSLGR